MVGRTPGAGPSGPSTKQIPSLPSVPSVPSVVAVPGCVAVAVSVWVWLQVRGIVLFWYVSCFVSDHSEVGGIPSSILGIARTGELREVCPKSVGGDLTDRFDFPRGDPRIRKSVS